MPETTPETTPPRAGWVHDHDASNQAFQLEYLPVPGGRIYRTIWRAGQRGDLAASICFVPDYVAPSVYVGPIPGDDYVDLPVDEEVTGG